MKATGIVRRIDDLGRVVIPKEIRRTMRIREGDPLEIYTDREGEVIFKKYSPVGELEPFAAQICESVAKVSNCTVAVTDRDSVIAVSGPEKKVLQEKNFVVTINQVVGVEVPDEVGGLARVLRILDDALINIEYMYDFLAIKKEKAYIIIRVENNAKTVDLLEKNGIRCIEDSDIVF